MILITFMTMPLSKEKLELLKKSFTEDAMSPGQAAKRVGTTYSTANRYYTMWASEIKESLERQLVPKIEESIKRYAKRRKSEPARKDRSSQSKTK
jgi:hypothetical protein